MPQIAELKDFEGAVWARVPVELGSPIAILSPAEIEANRQREERYLDEIERLQASQERLKSAIEFAHSEGFQWPSDPMAEFIDQQTTQATEK